VKRSVSGCHAAVGRGVAPSSSRARLERGRTTAPPRCGQHLNEVRAAPAGRSALHRTTRR